NPILLFGDCSMMAITRVLDNQIPEFNPMKNIITKIAVATLVFLFFERTHLSAQTIQEVTQPLSKKALNGYVHHIESEKDGSLHITYKIKGGKKTNEVFYERYSFGPDLKFTSA